MKILCAGDLSLDTYSPSGQSFFGGCSLNVARQLIERCQHQQTALYLPLGNDHNSNQASEFLESLKLEVRLKLLEGELPRQPITLDENNNRQLHDYHGGILPQFTCSDLGAFFLGRFELILFPFYKEVMPMAQSLFELKPDAKLACDFGNLSDFEGDLGFAQKFFPQLSYAQFSSEKLDSGRKSFFIEASRKHNLVIADTHGAMGASVYIQGHDLYCEAPKTLEVVDTTGAGDAFFAHFIHAHFVQQKKLKDSLESACEGGSAQVGHLGPGPVLLN